jgi:hypothetical protein
MSGFNFARPLIIAYNNIMRNQFTAIIQHGEKYLIAVSLETPEYRSGKAMTTIPA